MHISQSSLEKQNIYTHIYANTHNTHTHVYIYLRTYIHVYIATSIGNYSNREGDR